MGGHRPHVGRLGEDPWSTYRYAGAAAQLAFCLKLAKVADPDGIDWAAEASEAYAWAREEHAPGDGRRQPSLKVPRAYAAARSSGRAARRFTRSSFSRTPPTSLPRRGSGTRASTAPSCTPGRGRGKPSRTPRADPLRGTVHGRSIAVDVAAKRALRWGGNWYMPMLVGQQTTPLVLQLAVAHAGPAIPSLRGRDATSPPSRPHAISSSAATRST